MVNGKWDTRGITNPDLKKILFCQADYFVSTGIQEKFQRTQK